MQPHSIFVFELALSINTVESIYKNMSNQRIDMLLYINNAAPTAARGTKP
jgi:hypothetical protein